MQLQKMVQATPQRSPSMQSNCWILVNVQWMTRLLFWNKTVRFKHYSKCIIIDFFSNTIKYTKSVKCFTSYKDKLLLTSTRNDIILHVVSIESIIAVLNIHFDLNIICRSEQLIIWGCSVFQYFHKYIISRAGNSNKLLAVNSKLSSHHNSEF